MLLFLSVALANTCNNNTDRADTSCWLDDWEMGETSTLKLGIKGGKKWMTLSVSGNTVAEGKLEGARSKRTVVMEGCTATLQMEDTGHLMVTLDGESCSGAGGGLYNRVGNPTLDVPSHCGRKTVFSCKTTGGMALSVCEDTGLDDKGMDMTYLSLAYGTVGTPDTEVTKGTYALEGKVHSWTFASEGESYVVTAGPLADAGQAQLATFAADRLQGTVTCEGDWQGSRR